jgi:hypothetical protein
MPQPLLVGEVDNRDEVIRQLRCDLAAAQAENNGAAQAVAALKEELGPLYRGLQKLFGELDKVAGEEVAPAAANTGAWAAWRAKLPTKQWQFIEALMHLGSAATGAQLRAATKTAGSTTTYVLRSLTSMGLFVKVGNQYRLKDL